MKEGMNYETKQKYQDTWNPSSMKWPTRPQSWEVRLRKKKDKALINHTRNEKGNTTSNNRDLHLSLSF